MVCAIGASGVKRSDEVYHVAGIGDVYVETGLQTAGQRGYGPGCHCVVGAQYGCGHIRLATDSRF